MNIQALYKEKLQSAEEAVQIVKDGDWVDYSNLWHCSALDRKYIDQGRAYHSPMMFRHNGTYYRKGYAPVNVAMVTVAPMDENGNFSYGLMRQSISWWK